MAYCKNLQDAVHSDIIEEKDRQIKVLSKYGRVMKSRLEEATDCLEQLIYIQNNKCSPELREQLISSCQAIVNRNKVPHG